MNTYKKRILGCCAAAFAVLFVLSSCADLEKDIDNVLNNVAFLRKHEVVGKYWQYTFTYDITKDGASWKTDQAGIRERAIIYIQPKLSTPPAQMEAVVTEAINKLKNYSLKIEADKLEVQGADFPKWSKYKVEGSSWSEGAGGKFVQTDDCPIAPAPGGTHSYSTFELSALSAGKIKVTEKIYVLQP